MRPQTARRLTADGILDVPTATVRSGDVLLIAGKGHETGQIIGSTIVPFSDHEAVRASLIELNAELDRANEMVETKDRMEGLDIEAELAAWRDRRRRRLWGRYLEG